METTSLIYSYLPESTKSQLTETDEYFIFKIEKGLKELKVDNNSAYLKQAAYEASVIIGMKFPGYFLIVQNIFNYAKVHGIEVGPGRGSVAGSTVAWALGLTDPKLDPMKYGLYFERFLNPSRISMPDIDMDFEAAQRDKIISYLRQRYGADAVAQIGTFSYLRAKNAVKSVARTLGHPPIVGDELSKLLLGPIRGKPQPIKVSVEKVEKLAEIYKENGAQGDILRKAIQVENTINTVGVHASGVVISNKPLSTSVPLFLGQKTKEVATQWDMRVIEQYGLVKLDILGLKTLDKIAEAKRLIKRTRGLTINNEDIDIDDNQVWENLRAGNCTGIFQLESSGGMRDLCIKIRPTCLEDLTALVAIFRPGPLQSDEVAHYLQVRAGTEKARYLIPELEKCLGNTSGLMIYQEQVMAIAKELCGYTMAEADSLRKAIGKKLEKEMIKHESTLKAGWIKNNLDTAKFDILWKQIKEFAEYGFNKSHAAAYALLSYYTAWYKTHYPIEWMCSVLNNDKGNMDQMIRYMAECRELNIRILPPDINKSDMGFSIEESDAIRFGLSAIKNLGELHVGHILEERAEGAFLDIFDLCGRVNLHLINKKILDALALSGTLDSFKVNRASLYSIIVDLIEWHRKYKAYLERMEKYHFNIEEWEKKCLRQKEENPKKKLPSEPRVPKEPERPKIPELAEYPMEDILAKERELIGLYVTAHPLDEYLDTIKADKLDTINYIQDMENGTLIDLGAIIVSKTEITTKSKKKMAFLVLEDLTGHIEATVFSSLYEPKQDLFEEGKPLLFKGKVEVIETDEQKITKLNLLKIDVLPKKEIKRPPLTVRIPLDKAKKFNTLYNTYRGGKYIIKPIFIMEDGTQVVIGDIINVSNIDSFIQEFKT